MSDFKEYSQEEIEQAIDNAVKKLFARDEVLLNRDYNINERTVTHRLGMYLAEEFPEEDVDCEYNRMLVSDESSVVKRIKLKAQEEYTEIDDTDAKTVFPDIIVHRRQTNRNLLVIEVKMAWKNSKGDFDKLKAGAYKESLGYQFSVYLELGQNGISNLEWK